MELAWWIALGAVVALALVAAVVDGRGRLGARRRTPPTRALPEPGEVWWAVEDRPVEPHTPPGLRLCLVLSVSDARARVAPVQTGPEAPAPGELPLPAEAVNASPEDARTARVPAEAPTEELALDDLRHRAGRVEPHLWRQLRDGPG